MFALSTSWRSRDAESSDDILVPILDLGFNEIELEYRITDTIFREMLPFLKREQPSVVSVHNFFPIPAHLSRDQGNGDVFSLSSLDREERERAVEFTLPTLEHASEVGARAVVLHMGKTVMDDGFERLKEELEDGTINEAETQDYIESLKSERKLAGKKSLDAALFSLDKLWRPAELLGLNIGIENRYHLKDFPNADEFEVVFDRFDGGNVGYWHDVGHAAVQETLYGIGHEELLARLSPQMVGVHLHDAEGVRDHQEPGSGGIDFEMVKKYVPAEAIRVIELSPEVGARELLEGVDRLSAVFG